MTSECVLLSEISLPANAAAVLALAPGAAWIIAPRSGEVRAANAAGLARLSLRPDGANARLDGAMPALSRLRDLVRSPAARVWRGERLVFWSAGGVVALVCDVAALDAAEGGDLVAVHAVGAAAARGADGPGPALAAHRAPAPDEDAVRLRRIARRIRDGVRVRRHGEASRKRIGAWRRAGGARDAGAAPIKNGGDGQPAPIALRPVADGEPGSGLSADAGDAAHPDHIRRLAHELKTPLGAIAAAAEVMRDERLGPLADGRYLGYAGDIFDTARHALTVIDRMLAGIAVVSDEPDPMSFAEIDANALARSIVSQVAPLAARSGVELELSAAPRLPHIVADAVAVRQMLLNLISNALKFTLKGGHVTVATRYADDGTLAIEVIDTGSGMSAGDISRSLDARNPPKPERRYGGGLGLGLPLVRTLAEANGARLAVDSTPGQGTSARIIFGTDRVVPV